MKYGIFHLSHLNICVLTFVMSYRIPYMLTTQRIGLDFPTRNMEFSISYRKGFSRLRYEVTVNENMKSFPVQGDEQVSQKP